MVTGNRPHKSTKKKTGLYKQLQADGEEEMKVKILVVNQDKLSI